MSDRPPTIPFFPYTTLFRSLDRFPGAVGDLEGNAAVRAPSLAAQREAELEQEHLLEDQPHVRGAPRRLEPPHVQVGRRTRSEEHTSELQSLAYFVCRLLLET